MNKMILGVLLAAVLLAVGCTEINYDGNVPDYNTGNNDANMVDLNQDWDTNQMDTNTIDTNQNDTNVMDGNQDAIPDSNGIDANQVIDQNAMDGNSLDQNDSNN